jgi:hypothetical protein
MQLLQLQGDSEPRRLILPALRTAHGISPVSILLFFLMPHIANHLTAIWSVDAHMTVMRALRHLYELVQPLLVRRPIFERLVLRLRFVSA